MSRKKERIPKSYTRLYNIWRMMKQRCNNPNRREYHRYGGRGITVWPEWEHNFDAFEKWALSHGYEDDLTIDRINNDKGYSPYNCQWIPRSENSKKHSVYKKDVPAKKSRYKRLSPEQKHYNRMMRIYNELIKEGVDPSEITKPMPPV